MKPWTRYALMGFVGISAFLLLVYGLSFLFDARTGESFFSFAQFMVDLILMPTVIATFLITIYEFRKLQAYPDLALFLHSKAFSKEGTLLMVPEVNLNSPQEFYIINIGDKVALWYMVEIRMPAYLDPEVDPEVGKIKNIWQQGEWVVETVGDEEVFKFSSDGKTAVYPNLPLHLGHFNIQVPYDKKFDDEYKVSYRIFNDWGKPSEGIFTLRLVQGKKPIRVR